MEPNLRRCLSCRRIAPKSEFWRVVRVSVLGDRPQVLLDQGMGRSAYLCPCQDCLDQACRKQRLAKVLRTPIPPPIYQQLQERLPPPPRGKKP